MLLEDDYYSTLLYKNNNVLAKESNERTFLILPEQHKQVLETNDVKKNIEQIFDYSRHPVICQKTYKMRYLEDSKSLMIYKLSQLMKINSKYNDSNYLDSEFNQHLLKNYSTITPNVEYYDSISDIDNDILRRQYPIITDNDSLYDFYNGFKTNFRNSYTI